MGDHVKLFQLETHFHRVHTLYNAHVHSPDYFGIKATVKAPSVSWSAQTNQEDKIMI